ncbi:asparagine synthase C-terminal domain-containing protein [Natronorarus salvus]|uniref:asparagine synthase C-terminal domain-containing protein n=1 Tax=Natronorarus salvus TaxID=3117733 RepID=UPI002F2663A8
MSLHGASADLVERAIETADPLPGDRGFAGELPGGKLVRDVLGRYPLFTEREGTGWAFSPTDLADPVSFPTGHVRDEGGLERVWTLPEPEPTAEDGDAIEGLRDGLGESLDAIDTDGTAVAFSGGVDSAVVASALSVPCYVAGFEGSHDLEAARSAADLLGLELVEIDVTHGEIERAAGRVARATGRTNAMDVSIALTLFLVGERAAADGFDRLALGQGADELFGGYEKVARLDHRVEAESVRGAAREAVSSLPHGLERDVLALRASGVEPVVPLLDDRLIEIALRLDGEHLVRDGVRKWAFREAARAFVPDEVTRRGKKAVQYGSLVSRELDRLARQAGYKRRIDRHVDRYVESLLDSED